MSEPQMNAYRATMLAEGVEDGDEDEVIAAWQFLHDSRLAYQLQGWFGRQATSLIEAGVINP
jgi:hypothetical protein